jgi:hypothetical protein
MNGVSQSSKSIHVQTECKAQTESLAVNMNGISQSSKSIHVLLLHVVRRAVECQLLTEIWLQNQVPQLSVEHTGPEFCVRLPPS